MSESSPIASRVIESLIASGAVTTEQVAVIRSTASGEGDVGRQLVAKGLLSSDQLVAVLEDELGYPRVDVTSYAPDDQALLLVAPELARKFAVLPLFDIEGTMTVAIGSPLTVFSLDEFGAALGMAIDAVISDEAAIAAAIQQHFGAATASMPPGPAAPMPAAPIEAQTAANALQEEERRFTFEAPTEEMAAALAAPAAPAPAPVVEVQEAAPVMTSSIDLDVLAVADERRVAVLVAQILEQAVAQGANRIHLLPYKGDFFVVFRVQGRLTKVASAPISLQQSLVEGFKSYIRHGSGNAPALGRVHAEVAGREVVLTVSSVPTLAGQRLVVSISTAASAPRDLSELGMSDTETRALHAMVERGRGLLLVAAPVAGGRSTTYYSLLDHAAKTGKTAYSVERSIDFEIPAVAQVLVNPGEPIGAESYLAAGLRQDTDVIALDSCHTAEEAHLAIEAAGLGKLVIMTFAAGGIVAAVRRLLDLGCEPVSLANALTLGVAQRVVRTNCPNCSVASASPLAAKLPGADANMTTLRGAGCPACGNTGFAGATAVFEVLPFTEPTRGVIARGGTEAQIAAAASAEGLRPMIASGVAKVAAGTVSLEELDRVVRFSE